MRQQRKAMQPLQHRVVVSLHRTDSEIWDVTIGQAPSERLAALDAVAKHAAHEDMINFRDYLTDVDVE